MKKVLILLMVLGISSLANAATVLTWSVDGVTLDIDETVNVTLDADNNSTYLLKWVGNTAGTIASILDIVAKDAAGEDSVVQDPATTEYPGWWKVSAADMTATVGDTIQSGPQYDVTIKGLAEGTYSLASDNYGTNDTLEITVIPEPITIALLGLGGLLLRRRK